MTTTLQPIIVSGFDLVTVKALEAAVTQRDELLALARRSTSVRDAAGAERAAAILRDLVTFKRSIEQGRTTAKVPALQRCKDIDDLARTLSACIEPEEKRLGGLVATFNAEQKRIAEEERQAAYEKEQQAIRDAQRIQREADDKASAEQAERDRKAREEQIALALKASKAKTEAGALKLAKAAEEARQLKAEQDAQAAADKAAADKARDDAAFQAQATATAARLAVVPATTAGVSTREETCFEVTDAQALYDACPAFVTLTPIPAAIKAALKPLPATQSLPGVRHWKELRSVVR